MTIELLSNKSVTNHPAEQSLSLYPGDSVQAALVLFTPLSTNPEANVQICLSVVVWFLLGSMCSFSSGIGQKPWRVSNRCVTC